jgi:hypothetical protein
VSVDTLPPEEFLIMKSMRRNRAAVAIAAVGGAALMAGLAGCALGSPRSEAAPSQAATQPDQATPTATVVADATAPPSQTPNDDYEQRIAAIRASASASAAAASQAAAPAPRPPVAATATPRSKPTEQPPSAPKPKPSTGPFTGTGHIVAHLTDDRVNFRNSYHNGDRCSDGFHYMVDIYDSSEHLVKTGSMQFGILKNLQKHSSYVEFTCIYPFTFKLSGASVAYIFNAHEMLGLIPADYGTQAMSTARLRAGDGPSFQDLDD